MLTFDQRTIDDSGVFLKGELERMDQTINLPLVQYTYSRDIQMREDVTIADEMATWTNTQFAAAGSVNPNGKNWVSGNATALAGTLPDGANITTYFPGKPSGFYKSGSGIAGSPDINSWNDYIWINHGAHTYGQLISLLTDSRIAVRTLHDGRWGEWHIASSQAELAKKFDKTGGVIQGAADVKGHLSSSAGVVKANTGGIQVEIKTADRITEITSTYGGGEWFTHHLPRSSGTFAHTSDIDSAVAQTHKDIRALQGKTQDASTAQRGLVQLSDSRTSLSSSMAATSLTVSQNYADMKGLFGNISPTGKELGVTYQSKQGFAVFVHVDGISSTGSNFLSAVVNGVNFRGSMCAPLANQRIAISFMIPAGATYSVWQHSGVITDLVWVETDKR